MCLVLLIVSGTFLLTEQAKGRQQLLNNGRNFGNFSSQSIYDNYVRSYTHPTSEEFRQFRTAVEQMLRVNPDVVQVTLMSINGRVLFDSNEFKTGKYEGPPRQIEDPVILDKLSSTTTTQRDLQDPTLGNVAEIIVPINESGIGHVLSTRYILSYASLSHRTAEVFTQTASIAIPLMIFVIVVAVAFSLTLTRPIVKLTKVAQEIRAGNFNAKTNVTSKDEIGTLGLTIDEMTTQLHQTYGQLNHSLQELTQRTKQLSEEKARSSASIDSLPLGFMMTDEHGGVLVTNPAIRRMLNLGESAKKSANLFQQLQPHINTCLTEKHAISLPELTDANRIYRTFLSPVILSDNPGQAAIGVAVLLEDITEEKILARSKDEFFSIASHELRTPLTAIRGNSGMILDYFSEALKDHELKDMIVDIHGSSVRLIDIVNDFLDASRLEQGKMEFKPTAFPITDVLTSVITELQTVAAGKHVQLVLDPSFPSTVVWADTNKTKQVVYNLVGNALKFVEHGSVTLSAQTSAKQIKVLVTDTGKGISPENQSLLFHKFQQATDSILTRDNTRGTGLGLYISKLLVENMGGRIRLEHTETGKGSTFSFSLPLATAKQQATASSANSK